MSRLKNFSRNLATSYLQLGVNVVYSLVSVPLILHFLPKAEFGLWAVLVQLMGYASLVDVGMTSANARLLVDHKDDRENGTYGSLVKTAALVSVAQGLVVFMGAAVAAPMLAGLMKIPPEHQAEFIALLRIQGAITAATFSLRPLGMMLYAHQRMDLQSYADLMSLVVQLVMLVAFLLKGCGIYSFIYANIVTFMLGPSLLFWHCWRLRLIPRAEEGGSASWKIFQEVFSYGKQMFLFNLGGQLQMASQTILVSRVLGLEAAALWSVGTKVFNLMVPLMCRPNGAALPGLYEMMARGELAQLKSRFEGVVLLTASLGAYLGVSFALCNHLFVTFWTSGKIVWAPVNDVMLGIWLFVLSMQTTHCCFVNVTKKFGAMSYVLLAEGCAFICLTLLVGSRCGISGLIATSILCTLLFSYQYSLRRSRDFFHCSLKQVAWLWFAPSFKLAAIYGTIAVGVTLLDTGMPLLLRLALHAAVAAFIGGFLFVRFGFPGQMIREASSRLPRSAAWILERVAPGL